MIRIVKESVYSKPKNLKCLDFFFQNERIHHHRNQNQDTIKFFSSVSLEVLVAIHFLVELNCIEPPISQGNVLINMLPMLLQLGSDSPKPRVSNYKIFISNR